MTEDTNNAAQDELVRPWLSPSEALTRFVPQQQTQQQSVPEVAPIRFGFRVCDIWLLVPENMRSELVEETDVYPIPTTPIWFPGLINLRGSLVPVFDLKKLFNMEDMGGEKPNLLVLNTEAEEEEEAVSVLIDGLPLTLDTNKHVAQPPPLPLPEILQEHSQAVYVREQEIWVDFDFDGFFRAVGNRIAA